MQLKTCRIAEAYSVRENVARLWRSDCIKDGVEATVVLGPVPVKSETELRVALPLLADPVADRPNWTNSRLRAEIEGRAGVNISRPQLSHALRIKISVDASSTNVKGTSSRSRYRTPVVCVSNFANSRMQLTTSYCSTTIR